MKKILPITILLGFFSVSIIAQKTVRFYPKSEITGMTKNTDTYTIQSIKNEPKTFFIGYDEKKLTYGRGYLEFDLSIIPKDVTITKVSLQLTSKINWDNNFNGKIKIKETGLKNYADQVTWGQLAGGPDIITVEIEREGEGLGISNDYLKSLVQDKTKNKIKLYLALIHSNESKILRFTGDAKDLYLDVTYNSDSTEPNPEPEPEPGVDKYIFGPKTVYVGEEVEYNTELGYYCQGPVKYFVSWDYNKELFELIDCKDANCVQCYATKFKIKEIGQESITTLIKTGGIERFDGKDYPLGNGYYWVTIKYRPQKLTIKENVNIVCSNSTVTYQLNGLATFAKNATITWQAVSNMTLVSGQGTPTATFNGFGNGKGVVKATITYDGVDYPVENSDVWVGKPATPTISCSGGTNLSPNSSYTLTAKEGGGSIYTWNSASSDFILQEETTAINNTTLTTSYGTSGMSSIGTITCETKNICGNSTIARIRLNFSSSLKSLNTNNVEINKSQPTSIRIYSYPTGSIVYQKKNVIDFNIQNTNLDEGIYILEITDQNGDITREKVMKSKQ